MVVELLTGFVVIVITNQFNPCDEKKRIYHQTQYPRYIIDYCGHYNNIVGYNRCIVVLPCNDWRGTIIGGVNSLDND